MFLSPFVAPAAPAAVVILAPVVKAAPATAPFLKSAPPSDWRSRPSRTATIRVSRQPFRPGRRIDLRMVARSSARVVTSGGCRRSPPPPMRRSILAGVAAEVALGRLRSHDGVATPPAAAR